MSANRIIAAIAVVLSAFSGFASDTSNSIGAFIDPEASHVWRTATGNSVTLDIEYPPLAKSVTITLEGLGYSATFPKVTDKTKTISLPADTENNYRLTYEFDDGTVQKESFGVVTSQSRGSVASVSVRSRAAEVWSAGSKGEVIQIPVGTTQFTIDDIAVEAGTYGAPGWYTIPRLSSGLNHTFAVKGTYGTQSAEVGIARSSMVITVR